MDTPARKRISRHLRIYLIDRHPVARLGLRSFFDNHSSFSIVGDASTLTAALPDLGLSKPDVLITDTFPVPQAVLHSNQRFRVLYTFETLEHCSLTQLLRELRSGQVGFALKNSPQEIFHLAVRQVASDHTYRDPDFMRLVEAEQQRQTQSRQGPTLSTKKQRLQPAPAQGQNKPTKPTTKKRRMPKRKP